MRDKYGRNIEYVRISVTENCNLKCLYCSPDINCKQVQKLIILTPKDYGRIVETLVSLGVKKVRITGGEPLIRQDILEIISIIANISGIEDLSITTNGILLRSMAQELKASGLMRVNISLDSLKEDKFKFITGGGQLENVLFGIEEAINAGLTPVKINIVTIKGINDGEIDNFIELTKDKELDVRFIELMPIGKFGENNREKIINNSDIITSHPELILCEENNESLPARYYYIKGYKGRIGFISPMSHKFCNCCNRIRLTSDGKIKPCLGNNGEVDLYHVLRNEPDRLKELISTSIYEKPLGHNFEDSFNSFRGMSAIGG